SLSNVNLLGFITNAIAGDGSGSASASLGGPGGDLTNVVLEESAIGVRSEKAELDAGQGGDAGTGRPGKGGNFSGLTINNGDFLGATGLLINQGTHANGGSTGRGAGAIGGNV